MRSALNIIFGTSFTIATAWALGTLLFHKFALSFHRAEGWLLSFFVGSACLSAIVLALGAANLARKGVYLALGLLAIGWVLGLAAPRQPTEPLRALQSNWKWLLVAVFSAVSVFYLLQVVATEPKPSDLTNRLSAMDQVHGFDSLERPPDVAELPLLVAFAFGRHPAAALVNLALRASLALLVLYCGRRIGHPLVGVFTAFLVYASPVLAADAPAGALFVLFYVLHFRDRQDALLSPDVAQRSRLANISSAIASVRWEAAAKWGLWRPIIVASFILWFARSGLTVFFTGDDLMNMHWAWQKPLVRIVQDILSVWSPAYRPMGALVYHLFFVWIGLHALPFRILCFALMLLNCVLLYRVATRLGTREIGWVAVLLFSYNAGFVDLYLNGGTIYDILCFTFYFSAFDFYIRTRGNGLYLTRGRLIVFLALYLCALNSKEMAVTLPPILIACELIFGSCWILREPEVRRKWIAQWMPIFLSGLMTIAFVFGRFSNSSPLTGNGAYRLHVSIETYFNALAHYFGLLAYHPELLSGTSTALLLLLLLAISLVARERTMIFALFFLIVAPLPIAFVGLRGAYVMYIPAFGIGLYLASLLVKIREVLWARLRRKKGEPSAKKNSIVQAATFLLCAFALVVFHGSQPLPAPSSQDRLIQATAEQVAGARLNLHEGSRILFLDDPFNTNQEDYSLIYLVRLYYRIHEVGVERAKLLPVAPDQAKIDSYDILLHYGAAGIVPVKR